MRVVFVNLHANEMLVKTMNKYIFKHSVAIKHRYFLDYCLDNDEIEVCVYLNERSFSMMHTGSDKLLNTLSKLSRIEFNLVMKLNGIKKNKIKVITKNEITEDDIIITYLFDTSGLHKIDTIPGKKFISMIHFWGDEKNAELVRSSKINNMFNESNLKLNSEIFKKYYSWYKGEFIVHPFVFEERFKKIKNFNNRKNLAIAVGTITYREIPEYYEVYGDSCLQPRRKQIKDNEEELFDYIDSYVNDYNENSNEKKVSSKDGKLSSIYKKIYNKVNTGQQKKYFSFDMVEKLNEYKMCVVGEEVIGVPGIGFVEGMACGCAYIGVSGKMYSDYGLIEGVHYIGYDGTLENLKQVINFYQKEENQDKLYEIAKNGYEFVHNNFNKDIASKRLMKNIIEKTK